MEVEQCFERRRTRKVRVKVKTNRGLDFITAVKADATISDLANRALSAYIQLSEDGRVAGIKKQLTVSAVKQGIFYMPKSELVANLLNNDDEVEVVIIKAKPKYPNQLFQNMQIQPAPCRNLQIKPEPQLVAQPIPLLVQKEVEIIRQQIVEEEKDVVDNKSTISKRQKKKQKKLQKQKLKQQVKQKQLQAQKIADKQVKQYNVLSKSQNKNDLPSESKPLKQAQAAHEGHPRKKLKFQKQEISQKPTPIIVPSPKITFHNQPRLQSPKFSLLNESSKKKWEGQIRKPSEQLQKRSHLEKLISPVIVSRSPLIYQRSPNMSVLDNKMKDKDQLSNFSLTFRKLSEDKKIDNKKEKLKDQMPSPRKEDLKSSLKKDDQIVIQPQRPIQKPQLEKKQPQKREIQQIDKKIEPVKAKPAQSMVVVQQEDSDSQQNKKSNGTYVHHRQKELTEIQQKISQFYIHSDEE